LADAGPVTVTKNLTLAPGAALLAAFGGSDLNVGSNLTVGSQAILVLGCEPEAFPCLNDPDQVVGTLSTNDHVGGNLTANGALMVLAHNNTIGRNASVTGLGTCWLGFIRNTVTNNVNFNGNVTFDPDGNEVVTNSVGRNLNCSGNSPAPQVGDSGGSPNTVGGKATGRRVGLT